jgi:hypothetical protein
MIKTHNITGLKYLCKTEREDHRAYLGSGTYWKKHVTEHGTNISTEVIYETEDKQKFIEKARFYSNLWDIVNSKDWANLRPEEGDGGNTVSNKFWITNGVKDTYIDKDMAIPDGWRKGRSTGAFTNSDKQKELSSRVDRKKVGEAIKKAWSEGRFIRDHSRCGKKGELNPAKRSDVRKKIGLKNSKMITLRGITFSSIKEAAAHFNVKRHIIDKWRKDERSYKD